MKREYPMNTAVCVTERRMMEGVHALTAILFDVPELHSTYMADGNNKIISKTLARPLEQTYIMTNCHSCAPLKAQTRG